MIVGELHQLCDIFRGEHNNAPLIEISVKPWQAKERHTPIPHGDKVGVYIFARPIETNGGLVPDVNQEEVLYIGKSEAKRREPIASRVWNAFGPLYPDEMPTTPYSDPPFPMHRWQDREEVPDDIKAVIASGDVSVYTIKVDDQESGDWPRKLEAFLLHACRDEGSLPLLNKVLPRKVT